MQFRNIGIVAPAADRSQKKVALIASTSFEQRCLHVVHMLSKHYWADAALLCKWDGDYILKNRQECNYDELRKYLTFQADTSNITECVLKTYEPVITIPDLTASIEKLQSHGISHIDFDVSTFTKQYIMIILSLIGRYLPNASMRILYTPADRYGQSGSATKYLSERLRKIIAVPGFDAFLGNSANVKQVIVLFLGFEEQRASSLVTALKPAMCVPVQQIRRNTHLGAKASYDNNRRLLKYIYTRYYTLPESVDGENPISTIDLLTGLYEKWVKENEYTLLIAPHGSKMEAVGAYLFWQKVSDPVHVGVVYAMPVKYNERDYSGNPLGYIAELYIPCLNPAKKEAVLV